jgi:hypothetical protein
MQGKYSESNKKWRANNPLKARYSQMKTQCKHQGIELALEYEEMCAFFREETTCYYCGGTNTTNGLDRVKDSAWTTAFQAARCVTI